MQDDPHLRLLVVRGGRAAPALDFGAVVRWPSDGWRERLHAFEARMRAEGAWPSLLLAEGLTRPATLAAEIESRGWSPIASELVLCTRLPAVVPHLDPLLRLEAVTPRTAAEHEAVERQVFGLAASTAPTRVAGMEAGLADGTLRAYLVRSSGQAVAVGRLSLAEGVAGLFGIGVVAERRRQGLGTLVTTVATRAALAAGRRLVWLSVDETNAGARILYEGVGFRPAFLWRRWIAPPG